MLLLKSALAARCDPCLLSIRYRNMALPYDAIAPEAGGLQARKMSRARAVGATMAIAMVACVALLGITGGSPAGIILPNAGTASYELRE